ncbi:uncharacterized protein G2W53_002413 [Senna tora]|uniref:Uncharacterized protein n=1 Tax=Senna tora TaxID=362788 RepID=A0A834XJ94_9FABA|nr:uncharacterized protein G2W53_002413 [Senna tora]
MQEEGWPLGLRLLNARIGLVRNGDFSGSVSFSTMLNASPTSSMDSSSDLDTQSTGSTFHDKSITLGNMIGISSILELSGRSNRGRMVEPFKDSKKNHKLLKPCFFSLCSKLTTDAVITMHDHHNAPSLGHYLEEERRAASASNCTRNKFSSSDGPYNDFSPIRDSNSLFVEGRVVAPQCAASMEEEGGEPNRALLEQSNDGYERPTVFPCLCG